MFQDSVPAGSYNDPFLSSVCLICKDVKLRFWLFTSYAGGRGIQSGTTSNEAT